MKKKKIRRIACGILLVCILCTGLYFRDRYRMLNRVIGHQPMRIMVDNSLYMNYGKKQPERPDGSPDGTITELIGVASFPRENGQANFGSAGMPYWYVGDKVVVEYGQYYLFEQS